MEWFSSWINLRNLIGNARQLRAADPKLLVPFSKVATSSPSVAGTIWPSYHHAAVDLGVDLLAAVESAIGPMKVADIPASGGAVPADTVAAIRRVLGCRRRGDFDPDALRQNLAAEAAHAGIDPTIETWRPPLATYGYGFVANLIISPVPRDDWKPPGDTTQLHVDCFEMVSALCQPMLRVQSAKAEPPTESSAASAAHVVSKETFAFTKSKRSTEPGEAQGKMIAALTAHHRYANGGCDNFEPIGVRELARKGLADVSPSTATDFFVKRFGGHGKYKSLCHKDRQGLVRMLKVMNGEFATDDLYGADPDADRKMSDEDDQ